MFFLGRPRVWGFGESVLLENCGRNLSQGLGGPAHLEK